MGTLTYKLRKSTGKTAVIQIFFNYGQKKRFRYSTGLIIQDTKNWSPKDMRIKNVALELNRHIINEKLDDLQSKLNTAYKKLTIEESKTPSDKFFKDFCDEYFNKKTIVDKRIPELLPFYLWYIENYTTKPLSSIGYPLRKNTIKTYKSAYKLLLKYNKQGNDVNYSSINFDFYNDYIGWLQEEDYSTNYIGNQIKTLKTMMNSSYEFGYHKNLEHTKRYFKKPKEDSFSIYLTVSELKKIEECDFSNFKPKIVNKTLKITPELLNTSRDLFLISANTSLKISDIKRLNEKNIIGNSNGRKYLQITTKKTDKPLSLPLNSTVLNILDKRKGSFPKSIPPQHINYALKEIGELAEINEVILKKMTIGGETLYKEYKKYELITNHTARRSMITNAYLAKVPVEDIRQLSGHSSPKVFESYLRLSGLERAEKIGEHPFFS
ncbi:hypothetical protein EC396_13380 [Lutibacter sp. HS1-25]|uniref:phage integrase SAM-like domain-containing protein n=1 Tax=Lutibacter sp. HS1-25 TaxID=2485000 RepID=UPI0010126623|nr:phage integrase SAM-like domain-containing protein [Lutibacter sp. HS1-25]RXP46867.1 hypothetical protein EC396_13380 [Lutibacter sp. HS1-25]